MKGRLLCLLLALSLGCWGIAGPGVCAGSNPPLVLAPTPQQGPGKALAQGGSAAPEALHDIRGPVVLPEVPGVLFWILIGLAVLVLVGLYLYLRTRRTKDRKELSPDEIALAELARLQALMNPEQALIYADQLAEILRRYVEARFLIRSTRQTTREFFLGLTRNSQAVAAIKEHHHHLQECLEQCDMAKFAHFVPDQQGMETMEQAVRGFIEATGQSADEKGKG